MRGCASSSGARKEKEERNWWRCTQRWCIRPYMCTLPLCTHMFEQCVWGTALSQPACHYIHLTDESYFSSINSKYWVTITEARADIFAQLSELPSCSKVFPSLVKSISCTSRQFQVVVISTAVVLLWWNERNTQTTLCHRKCEQICLHKNIQRVFSDIWLNISWPF